MIAKYLELSFNGILKDLAYFVKSYRDDDMFKSKVITELNNLNTAQRASIKAEIDTEFKKITEGNILDILHQVKIITVEDSQKIKANKGLGVVDSSISP